MLETRQGLKISCPEEIAFRMGYIDADAVRRLAEPMRNNSYGRYLLRLVETQIGTSENSSQPFSRPPILSS